MKKSLILLPFVFLIFGITIRAQETNQIDASKPTNFYSYMNNSLEFTSRQNNGNLIGYRANITYSPSERHLFLGEVPLQYNLKREKFGLGDIRVRYFYLPYKNYEKFIGALGPSVDIIAPTGNASNGIGTGRWIIAPGLATALMFADWIQCKKFSFSFSFRNCCKLKLKSNHKSGTEIKTDRKYQRKVVLTQISA